MTRSRPSRSPWWPVVPVLCLAAVVYGRAIGDFPVYLGGDEARFATAAHSIASSGRDLAGVRMPLFFHMTDSVAANDGGTRWYQPVLVYLIALSLKVSPLTESAVRLPAVVIGIVDVWLIYAIARRLFPHSSYPALASLTLAFSPAHFIFSRQALDYICPLPFVLGWLLCLIAHLETGSAWQSLAAGVVLGVGFYSYIAAWAMMPLFLLLTWIVQRGFQRASLRAPMAAAVGFALPVLVVLPWLWSHPDMWRDTMGRYKLYDARHLTPLQGVKDFLNYNNVQERLSVYWDYFNPAYLFFSGGSNLTTATRKAGVFLLPVSVFLVCGASDLWRRRTAIGVVLLAGLALAPVPAVLVDERYAIQRELFVLPFAALISVFGVAFLLGQRTYFIRPATIVLLLAMPIQFGYFYRDYFSDYRIRSAFWFDPANVRGVAEYLIANDSAGRAPAVYLSQDLDDVAARWRFYLAKHRREDLLQRTRMFAADGFDVSQVPAGSLLVLYANDPRVDGLVGPGKCSVATVVTDVAGGKAAVILRKTG